MKPDSDRLSISRMRRHLETEMVGYHVYLFGTVAAARAAARRLAAHGADAGTVVAAEDEADGTVHVSVLFRPDLAPCQVAVFAPIAALAAAEAIEAEGVDTAIRWPHDVVIDDRPLARTLVESESVDDRLAYVILGIDIDVAAAGDAGDPNVFVARFLTRLEQWHRVFTTQGPEAVVAARRTHGAHRGHLVAAEEVR
jgi:BirA family transcriptional regulator, biotin operon repressor / biotin---[acetyl-CoA-carboxylase] ligase